MKRLTTLAAAAAFAVLGSVPDAGAADTGPDLSAVTVAAVEHHILPRYRTLEDTGAELRDTADAFCAASDAPGLGRLRDAFHATWDAWASIQHIGFGPITYLNRAFRLQYWPDKRNSVARELAALIAEPDPDRLEQGAFAKTTVALQGLPALERLLFDGGGEALLAGDAEAAWRCDIVRAIGGNIATMAAGNLRNWTDETGYAQVMETTGAGSMIYREPEEAVAELLRSIATALEITGDLKLAPPLGKSAAQARPKTAEAWRSGRSLRNIRLSVAAVDDLYRLGSADAKVPSMAAALDAVGRTDLDTAMQTEFEAVRDDLAAVDGTLFDAVRDDDARARFADAIERMRALRGRLVGEIAPALGVVVGFNSLDGD